MAVQIEPTNSRCHALLGVVYINQKLAGMAKVSFQQALKLNPQEAIALQYLRQIDSAGTQGTTGTSGSSANNPQEKKDAKKGGFFGWLSGN